MRENARKKKNKKNTYLFLISCDLWIEKLQASVNLNTQQTHIKDLKLTLKEKTTALAHRNSSVLKRKHLVLADDDLRNQFF